MVYGRQPSWHKYNVIGGWPKRIKSNLIHINPLPQTSLQKTAMALDSAGVSTTGPEAIYYALQNLDLQKKQQEAESVIQRKLKSKRPDAVKVLGYIQGMKKAGINLTS